MKIILLEDVKGVGKRFEEKPVSDGYAMNFLIPRNLAVPSSPSNQNMVKQLKEQSDNKRAEEEKVIEEKELKRQEKHEALEKFRAEQKESSS